MARFKKTNFIFEWFGYAIFAALLVGVGWPAFQDWRTDIATKKEAQQAEIYNIKKALKGITEVQVQQRGIQIEQAAETNSLRSIIDDVTTTIQQEEDK